MKSSDYFIRSPGDHVTKCCALGQQEQGNRLTNAVAVYHSRKHQPKLHKLTPLGSDMERADVVLGSTVDISSFSQQQPGYRLVPIVRCYVKRREA